MAPTFSLSTAAIEEAALAAPATAAEDLLMLGASFPRAAPAEGGTCHVSCSGRAATPPAVSYTHLTLPTIYSV